ncbi:hypothetical protein G7084_00450 [Weissella coleopterorum]|uniref:Uncharacterized protein n=1 Tax=Weissella coleopterorum TaxID=2714949 RepID=A0A6G8AXY7_9LACO|nr:hypothetical protein [Weissella coleopterorum]QIL49928.1 hypothetical protein G7084_00450 [Weissella coleopterorum]
MEKWNKMSAKVKSGVVTGIILGIAIIIGLYAVSMSSNNDTTDSFESSSSVSSSSSETSSQYKEGRDYTIKRSNKGVISDKQLQEALDNFGDQLETSQHKLDLNMPDMVEITFYYDSTNNRIIVHNVNDKDDMSLVTYSFDTKKEDPSGVTEYPRAVEGMPVVWSFKNNLLKTNE